MARKNAASFMLHRNAARVLALVKQKPRLSYDDMAAQLDLDRRTVILAAKKLEQMRHIVVVRDLGKQNRYITTDKVIELPHLGV